MNVIAPTFAPPRKAISSSFMAILALAAAAVLTAPAPAGDDPGTGDFVYPGECPCTVFPGYPNPLPVNAPLQVIIDGASPGSTLCLDGTYNQTISINKRLTIRGTGQSSNTFNNTIIDGNDTGRVIFINGAACSGTVIQGMTVRNGLFNNDGVGIFVKNAGHVELRDLEVRENVMNGNASDRGAGIYSENTHLVIRDCNIVGNQCIGTDSDGGGLYVTGGTALVANTYFNQNTARDSGAGARFDNTSAQLINCYFLWNGAFSASPPFEGGAIWVGLGTTLTVDNTVMNMNRALTGDAVFITGDKNTVRLRNCRISYGNETGGATGKALYNARVLSVENCTIYGNTGALQLAGGNTSTTILNSIISNNGGSPFTLGGNCATVRSSMILNATGLDCLMECNNNLVSGNTGFADVVNFELAPGSAAIDAGTSELYLGRPLDLGDLAANPGYFFTTPGPGKPRIAGDAIDLGAREYQPPAPPETCPQDIDGNNIVGTSDLLSLLAAWGVCP